MIPYIDAMTIIPNIELMIVILALINFKNRIVRVAGDPSAELMVLNRPWMDGRSHTCSMTLTGKLILPMKHFCQCVLIGLLTVAYIKTEA